MAPATPPTKRRAPAAVDDHGPRQVVFSPRELAFLIGVPLLWALLLLFHPGGEGKEIYLDAQDEVTRFLVVHVGMMLFIPLMAVAVYLLVDGVEGTAATVSRIALVPFVVFYSAWEALQGIGVGILVDEVNGLPKRNATPAQTWFRGSRNRADRRFFRCASLSSEASRSSRRRPLPGSRFTATRAPPAISRSCSASRGSSSRPIPRPMDPPGSSFSSWPCCSTCEADRDPPTS